MVLSDKCFLYIGYIMLFICTIFLHVCHRFQMFYLSLAGVRELTVCFCDVLIRKGGSGLGQNVHVNLTKFICCSLLCMTFFVCCSPVGRLIQPKGKGIQILHPTYPVKSCARWQFTSLCFCLTYFSFAYCHLFYNFCLVAF